MKVKANPLYEIYLRELGNTKRPFKKWAGICFRAAPLEFAGVTKLLDGRGSLKFGGRWSAPGTVRAVNMSLTQETALDESQAKFSYYNFRAREVAPKVLVAVQLRLGKVIDLTALRGLPKRKWVRVEDLLAEDWRKVNDAGHESISQAFGRAAHDIGAQALLVPSARVEGGSHLVFFPESLVEGTEMKILGEKNLERWLKKR